MKKVLYIIKLTTIILKYIYHIYTGKKPSRSYKNQDYFKMTLTTDSRGIVICVFISRLHFYDKRSIVRHNFLMIKSELMRKVTSILIIV